jgi:hypothetical protein
LGKCDATNVHDNVIIDATDVGIVNGGGPNCQIAVNDVLQVSRHAFTGIHMANFAFEGHGDHSGSSIAGNTVRGSGLMSFGIAIGFHPWDSSLWTTGGTVAYNSLSGSVVNLLIDGACGVNANGNALSAPAASTLCSSPPHTHASYVVNTQHVDSPSQCSGSSSAYAAGFAAGAYDDSCLP